jgi:hypothetical protein
MTTRMASLSMRIFSCQSSMIRRLFMCRNFPSVGHKTKCGGVIFWVSVTLSLKKIEPRVHLCMGAGDDRFQHVTGCSSQGLIYVPITLENHGCKNSGFVAESLARRSLCIMVYLHITLYIMR